MEYNTSKQMLNNAEHLVKLYKTEQAKATFIIKCSTKHKKEDRKTLESMSIALTAMSMLMNDCDKQLMVDMLQNEGLANKLIKAISRVKLGLLK